MYRFFILLLSGCWLLSCQNEQPLFKKIDSGHSGIHFNNKIVENDTLNPLDVVNIYNGGGVGIGDVNGDSLPDIYLTGNLVPSKLYLNRGNFKFDDITDAAGVAGMGRWARGVAVVDINNDGLMDLYVCNTIDKDSLKRRNILYVNQGVDKSSGMPHFKDLAQEYGLDVHLESTMASFFDYDNDGDLDVYITVNTASVETNPSIFLTRNRKANPSMGKLYRNDMHATLKHAVYTDVSEAAGINLQGYGHGATVVDINEDGWKDIYVANDFISSNILYINNGNGTFTDRSKEYFKHTSLNAMGQDVIDINGDGLADVVELDMSPPDNYRKKMMLNANNYNTTQNFSVLGYQFQYVRNTLQLNGGPRLLEGDTVGAPVFSEIGFMSGVAQTDWSWTPLVADFNNDARRDIIVTNGFPKDVSDHDFIAYRREAYTLVSKMDLTEKIPEVKLHNYAFQNKDGLLFDDATTAWGLATPSFSNGAAYADLDRDGDLDVVMNNINDEAFLYENTARTKRKKAAHFLQIAFEGDSLNKNGIGAVATIYYKGQKQVYENMPYRGYISSNQAMAHFGLGDVSIIDSVVVKWSNSKVGIMKNVAADQLLKVKVKDAGSVSDSAANFITAASLFKEITTASGIAYQHHDHDFIDFNIQTTLPHKLSEYNPALVAGDVDNNGLDDLIIGGNNAAPAKVFLQQPSRKFLQQPLVKEGTGGTHFYKDGGLLLLDANGDGSLDLYATGSGYTYESGNPSYQDRLYLNDGKGAFTLAPDALPANHTSKLCVRAFDYNRDGRPDLFVSGRVDPHHYPKPVSSFIYRNDAKGGKAKFTDVTAQVAPELQHIGMVCDALVTDFDNDNEPDLLLAGEWMPVTFLKNTGGKLKNVTAATGIEAESGWWNSIVAGDFRHTGRTDYIVGNMGLNSLYKASHQYPVFITAKDFDNNGGYEAIPSIYLPDEKGTMREYPAHGRDDIIDKMPVLKKKYNDYRTFALSTFDQVFTEEERNGALRLQVTNSQSCYLRNDGGGKFTMIALPLMAQVSTLNGMVADDFNADGNLDVLINGNDYGTEVSVGRYDALNGLLLKGDGKGGFAPLSVLESGIYIPGNGKALVKLLGADSTYLVAASQNQAALKLFALRKAGYAIKLAPANAFALIYFKNGKVEKKEMYQGSSFLSQSAQFLYVDKSRILKIVVQDAAGRQRTIVF